MSKKIIIILVIILVMLILSGLFRSQEEPKITNFEECITAGYPVSEAFPGQCSDGTYVFIKELTEPEMINEDVDGNLLDAYKNLEIIEESEFLVEISRSKRECEIAGEKRMCLQVKKENGDWGFHHGEIYGFEYEVGTYYLLRVKERIYNTSNLDVSENISKKSWELTDIIKSVPENTFSKEEEMTVKIPRVELVDDGGFSLNYDEYLVPVRESKIEATLEKLFEIRSTIENEREGIWNGFKFGSISMEEDTAIIELTGTWFPVGGMSAFYFKEEVESAAKQFDAVNNVRVVIGGKIFDWCVNDKSDGEGGCPEKKQLWDTGIKKNI